MRGCRSIHGIVAVDFGIEPHRLHLQSPSTDRSSGSQAHSHARNALVETRKSNPVAASEEHDLAAGEFATAAQKTLDKNALRTLLLLEQHHKRLAKIIRFQHENPVPASSPEPTAPAATPSVTSPAAPNTPSRSAPFTALSPPVVQQPPRLQTPIRTGGRETTSLASNLASARGIPAYSRGSPAPPTLSTQNENAKMAEMTHKPKRGGTEYKQSRSKRGSDWTPSWSPAISPTEAPQKHSPTPDSGRDVSAALKSLAGDEPFRRFYSTFGGLISKMSAPLAFASLPLGVDVTGQHSPTASKSSADTKLDRYSVAAADLTHYSTNELDVKKLVSSAALRAIRDKDGYFSGNSSESFYVVPTSGGMISYAGILSRAEREARRSSFDDDEDTFVDARENPPSPETKNSMSRDKNKGTSPSASASRRPLPGQDTTSSNQTAQVEMDKVRELEELVKTHEQELEKVARENEKLRNALGRYRERWERLKEGARNRREGNGSSNTARPSSTTAIPQTDGTQQDLQSPAPAVENGDVIIADPDPNDA
ncbi:predicted protein [Uncinocarpus reesii 1704]|uniref:Uncharacterized protein n=1 Tax=Uncinocarpus reesii (strain UAMH 1704) TaxID=336963 RepID=C4JN81_UNCRE|nr:uncharacterized protein UREG_04287 [Uncinocarpus reesii 1704]EEP79441.1 predicted protein [Uncinocarpus reesii 1704]